MWLSYSTVFSIPWQCWGIYPFRFLLILLYSQPGQQSPQFCKFSSFLLFIRSGRLADHLFVSQNPRGVCVCHSPGQILDCAYTTCSCGQSSISCTIPTGSLCSLSRVLSYTLSVIICCIRLLCDWSFRLCLNITDIYYFVASYLFLLWYDLFL